MTVSRGTTNTNVRDNTTDRARRRAYLVATYRANVDGALVKHPAIELPYLITPDNPPVKGWTLQQMLDDLAEHMPEVVVLDACVPLCRCYRCGDLLTVDSVSADRIVPGIQGGTYRRENIRPACDACQSITGALLAQQRKAKKETKK